MLISLLERENESNQEKSPFLLQEKIERDKHYSSKFHFSQH